MTEGKTPHSHLFIMRLWSQEIENGRSEWRGRVQYMVTNEVHYFREWSGLLAIVQQMLPDLDADEGIETVSDD